MCPGGTQVNAHREQKYNRTPDKEKGSRKHITKEGPELELMQQNFLLMQRYEMNHCKIVSFIHNYILCENNKWRVQ